MEKIININFQGRVIAIEETAYDQLKLYIDGLRGHFAKEESHEEIMSDIEDRIGELLSDRLKQGIPCIGMADVKAVMDSIGRLEDIAAAEAEENGPQPQSGTHSHAHADSEAGRKDRLYRNGDDTLIAGVCSGIAIRTGIDPTIVRIAFVLLSGALFWVYLLLWILVPSRSMRLQSTRRFYRDREGKMIAGICSGLAAYFGIDRWILRTILFVPLAIGVLSGDLFSVGWNNGFVPGIFLGSVGGTLFILYAILWIVVPYADSPTERMEMRGERIDLNSIKAATQARAGEAVAAGKRAGSGLGRLIGLLFKAFFLFIAGIIAISLFAVLIAMLFAGTAVLPFTDFIFYGEGQHIVAWVGLGLTLGIPLLAIVVWLVRRVMRVHTRRHYLGYVFAGLWLTGITCVIITTGILVRGFSTRAVQEDIFEIQQPSTGVLYIAVNEIGASAHHARHDRWFGDENNNDAPFRYISKDSLWLNNVRVNIEQSKDTLFHVYRTRASRGNTSTEAKLRAEHFSFDITQQDSVIGLPDGFTIGAQDKFRNQQVLVTVEVPLGKKVSVSNDVDDYSWYNIDTKRRHGHYERHWRDNDDDDIRSNTEYIMTVEGLKDPTDTVRNTEE